MLPWLSIGQIAEFQAVSCRTIEQLIGMPDAMGQKFMGFHAIKARAQTYLDAAKSAAPLLKMEAELKKRDEKIEELQTAVAALISKNAAKQE
jgi:tryptophan 2,3-dioxygenase